jgi:endonuclease/exonuclease/phosphatase family metal-dependent hydrolase
MQIISWNIQAAKGVDDVTSMDRIAETLTNMGDADIICCQEVLQEFDNQNALSQDQAQQLSEHFPEHRLFYGAAIDRLIEGRRVRFGNLVLSRMPALSVAHHRLPQPADPENNNMVRQAVDVVVEDKQGTIYRIITTHLEYFSSLQRRAQVDYLCSYCRETRGRANTPSSAVGYGFYTAPPETRNTILCGDLNLTPHSDDYNKLTTDDSNHNLLDAWTLLHPDQDHRPTCGIFDKIQWPEGAHCRDYFFLAPELKEKTVGMHVDTETEASDHQPIMLVLT